MANNTISSPPNPEAKTDRPGDLDERAAMVRHIAKTVFAYLSLLDKKADPEATSELSREYAKTIARNREQTTVLLDPKLREYGSERVFGPISMAEITFAHQKTEDPAVIQTQLIKQAQEFVAKNTNPDHRSRFASNQKLFPSGSEFVWPETINYQ